MLTDPCSRHFDNHSVNSSEAIFQVEREPNFPVKQAKLILGFTYMKGDTVQPVGVLFENLNDVGTTKNPAISDGVLFDDLAATYSPTG